MRLSIQAGRAALFPAVIAVVAAAVLFSGADTLARAQTDTVRFFDFGMESQFPEGIRFFASVESDVEIEDIRVIFVVGERDVTQYNYLDLSPGGASLIGGDLLVKTGTPERYIPPGAIIKFHFETIDVEGNLAESDRQEVLLLDARFEWDTLVDGPVTVYFHGPVGSRAETLAAKSHEVLRLMQRVTGSEIETPIAIMLYNNRAEMIEAVVPRSATISRELVTEGQAFNEENTVLVLAGRSDIGTATHEITHILISRASNGAAFVPFWLSEGLAEFGNLNRTVSYTRFLEWGVGTGRLPSLRALGRAPGDPNMTLVGYGIGRSAVSFMLKEFGPDRMAQLLNALGAGLSIDRAVQAVYGMSLNVLENLWRDSIGADQYIPVTPAPASSRAAPTATAEPLLLFTLDDAARAGQAGAEAVEATEEPAQDAPGETPTPAPQPEETPVDLDGLSPGGSCNVTAQRGPAQATPVIGLGALAALWLFRALRRRFA